METSCGLGVGSMCSGDPTSVGVGIIKKYTKKWNWKFIQMTSLYCINEPCARFTPLKLIRKNTTLMNLFCVSVDHTNNKYQKIGREPLSSGYGRRLMNWRLWVRFPATYTGWTFFHIYLFVVKFVMCVWNDENKWKRGCGWPLFKKYQKTLFYSLLLSKKMRWTDSKIGSCNVHLTNNSINGSCEKSAH